MRYRSVLALCLWIVVTLPRIATAQVRPEVLRGRVTADSGTPLAGVTVSATMAPDRAVQQTATDSAGRFAIRLVNGTGDYLVHASAIGFRPFRTRVTRAPTDTAFNLDIRLQRIVARLTAVSVRERRERPQRSADPAMNVGAVQQQREGVYAALTPDQEGNLAAIANAIPGATSRPEGLSVLGLGGDQSNTTLNGMAFGGAALPRDAQTRVRVATSTYDPSRGGFSGGQIAVELGPGSPFYLRRSHLLVDAPPLQLTTPVGDRLGQRFTSINGSIGGSGEAVENVWYYNSALQVFHRRSDAPSLLSVGDQALVIAGIAPDSATRLSRLLAAAGVPLTSGAVPAMATSQAASFVARFDHAPYVPGAAFQPARETWNLTFVGNANDDQASSFAPTNVPTFGGRRVNLFAGGQAAYSRYVGDALNETKTAVSLTHERGRPYLSLPGGAALVSSALPDGGGALTTVSFGGNSGLAFARRGWTWEAVNETQWYTNARPHRLKLTAETRFDGYFQTPPANLLGAFSFASLAALEANQPSSYSRTLRMPARHGGEWSGFLALGDYWRITPSLQLLYGARVEGNRYVVTLAENPAIAAAFGSRTSHAPNTVHASPRVGFTWFFGKAPGNESTRFTQVASQTMISTMVLRGGIGEFRGFLPPTLLADATASNGLPGGSTSLLCIGPATPIPQWADYLTTPAAIPTSCADGAPTAFTDVAPSVRLFDRSFTAPRSWRANLEWARTLGPFGLTVEGIYSLNVNQPGTVDLNFSDKPSFVLADEGNRPVFVSPSSIVPATGVVSPAEARVSAAFARVVSSRSDLRSTSRQLTVVVTPKDFNRFYYSLAYTWSDMRADVRGFDATSFDTPERLGRAPGDLDARHQILASVGTSLPHGMTIALFGRFLSGLPYTPRIATDVNGDGLANDRAFIFDPRGVADPSLASGMQALLGDAPSQARACLSDHIGRPAGHNSCRGPWTAYMNARIGIVNKFGFTRRSFTATLNLINPLGGLDQLLHGPDRLHGWGSGALPDPTLLTVRGFDPVARSFQYEVNPRFGGTRSAQQLARVPFRIAVDMNFDLGVPVVKQQAMKLLKPGRAGRPGTRLTADSMAVMLRRQVPDIYRAIMSESDSLLIAPEQIVALQAAQVPYRARVDSVWREASAALAAMEDDYDADAAMHLIDDATERAWILSRDELPVLARILTPLQLRLAPLVPALQQTVGKKTVGMRMFAF
jgi:hypothetical protein